MLPRSGAGVRYPRLTHGAFLSWFNGWGYLIAALALPVIEVQAVLTYIGGHWSELGLLEVREGVTVLSWPVGIVAGFALLFVFFVLNSFGAKFLSESNKYVTIWKLVIPLITAGLMFSAFDAGNFTIGGGFVPMGGGAVFSALAGGGIVFAYSGLRQILDFGGEVVRPQRNIPLAIIVGGLLIPLVMYLLLQISFIGAIDWSIAGVDPGDWVALMESDWASAPLLNAVIAAGFGWFSVVLLSDAALSPAATGWVWLGIGTRSVYSMSVNRELPAAFQRTNRFGTPIIALIGCFALGLVFFFPAPSWYLFVGMASIALTLSYVMGGPVLAVLRRTAPGFPRPVRLRAANWWALAGYVASLLLIYFAGWVPLINLFTVLFLALPIYGAYTSVKEGWSRPFVSWALSLAFVFAWVWIAIGGGWLATLDQRQRPDGWGFAAYYGGFVVLSLGFLAALAALSSAPGRRNLRSGVWLVVTLLALLGVSYGGQFGPLDHPPIGGQLDIALMTVIAVLSFAWAVRSGGPTEELDDILEAQREAGASPEPRT